MKQSKKISRNPKRESPPLTQEQVDPLIQVFLDVRAVVSLLVKQSTSLLVENQILRTIPHHSAGHALFWLHEAVAQNSIHCSDSASPCSDDSEPSKPNLDTFQTYKVAIRDRSKSSKAESFALNESQISSILSVKVKSKDVLATQAPSFQPIPLNSIVERGDQDAEDEHYRELHDEKTAKIVQEQNFQAQMQQELEKKERDLLMLRRKLNMSSKGYTYDYNGNVLIMSKTRQHNAPTLAQPLDINVPDQATIKEFLVVETKQAIERPQQTNSKKKRTVSEYVPQLPKGTLEVKMPLKQTMPYETHFNNLTEQQKLSAMQEPTLKLTKSQYHEMQELYDKLNREKVLARQQLRQKQLQAQLFVKETDVTNVSNQEGAHKVLRKHKLISSQGIIKYIKEQHENKYLVDQGVSRNDESTQLPQLPQSTERSHRLLRTRSAVRSRVFSGPRK